MSSKRKTFLAGGIAGAVLVLGLILLVSIARDVCSTNPTEGTVTTTTPRAVTTPKDASAFFNLTAISHAAAAITGDIQVSPDGTIAILHKKYSATLIRELRGKELEAAARMFSVNVPTTGSSLRALYRINIPARDKLLNGNTLCGTDDAKWVVYLGDDENHWNLAFFSGDSEPSLNSEENLCGTYSYEFMIPGAQPGKEPSVPFQPNAVAKSLATVPGAIVPGTPVQVNNSDAFTTGIPAITAKLPDGKMIRGVTLPSMLSAR